MFSPARFRPTTTRPCLAMFHTLECRIKFFFLANWMFGTITRWTRSSKRGIFPGLSLRRGSSRVGQRIWKGRIIHFKSYVTVFRKKLPHPHRWWAIAFSYRTCSRFHAVERVRRWCVSGMRLEPSEIIIIAAATISFLTLRRSHQEDCRRQWIPVMKSDKFQLNIIQNIILFICVGFRALPRISFRLFLSFTPRTHCFNSVLFASLVKTKLRIKVPAPDVRPKELFYFYAVKSKRELSTLTRSLRESF